MELIDKEKVIKEVKKVYDEGYKFLPSDINESVEDFKYDLLRVLDTLEVKEVDLDKDIRTYLTNHFNIYEDTVLQSKKSGLPLRTYDIIKVAEHFFELGINARKGG